MRRIIFSLALAAALSILPGLFMIAFWHEASLEGYKLHWFMWASAGSPVVGGAIVAAHALAVGRSEGKK